jgi:hypothetical protein
MAPRARFVHRQHSGVVSFDQESTAEIEYEVMFEVSIGNPLHPGRLGVITPMLDWDIGRLD